MWPAIAKRTAIAKIMWPAIPLIYSHRKKNYKKFGNLEESELVQQYENTKIFQRL